MSRRLLHISALFLALFAASCIHNDIPYPWIQANILSLQVKGSDGAAIIDSTALTVTIPLPEETDIYAVQVTGYTITPGATLVDNPFAGPLDLSQPKTIFLNYYTHDWAWKISATQDITRYFEVDGQIGETTIDVPGKRVVVAVRAATDMTAVRVVKAKLGPVGSVMTPDLADGGTYDARKPFPIKVEAFGRAEIWTVYTDRMEESVRTESADAWTKVAWVTGSAEAGMDNGVEYRLSGTEEWTRVPADDITSTGGSFTACIKHLSPQSAYEARAYSGEDYGQTLSFTTGSDVQLPNSDFEYWWKNKAVWYPYAEDGEPFWGTGNPGAATLGQSNVTPTTDTPTGSGYAACLETRFVGIGTLGKLAAGSVFAGYFVRTDGTNGVLSMGREFTQRPVKVRGTYKYTGSTINYVDKNTAWLAAMNGQPDTCIIWCALVDCNEPVEIRTNPSNRQLFDSKASYVIAYGQMQQWQTITEYIPFEFELNYNSTSRVPKYILLTAASSKYGDYFTGGTGSVLYLDDIHLEYDY